MGAAAVPVGDSTLTDQTISFIQELTEAVQEVPGTVVVATLPASKLEVPQSEKGQEAYYGVILLILGAARDCLASRSLFSTPVSSLA